MEAALLAFVLDKLMILLFGMEVMGPEEPEALTPIPITEELSLVPLQLADVVKERIVFPEIVLKPPKQQIPLIAGKLTADDGE